MSSGFFYAELPSRAVALSTMCVNNKPVRSTLRFQHPLYMPTDLAYNSTFFVLYCALSVRLFYSGVLADEFVVYGYSP